MNRHRFDFSGDDFHPMQPTSADIILRQQLEYSLSKYFYEGCDRTLQNLLSNCRWYVTTQANAMTLVIECPMGKLINQMVSSAKIRVCPPESEGVPFEMRVDELSVYRDMA